ncbi:CYTH domain-containing protein [Kurthia sibirica]|uniref:Adenylate cyclase n=1 Tax=Kurthia sibirica TaxID=202750 RepID=A0A2U3AMW2_9BACL|nr:CYTH domain-containing protein [Kurthia sibirica]PWI25856.1 adenylate cyclase [Kurthia sibirica]GEK34292.1 adenylate cyclase [Kurthia sibirica]
MSQQLEIEFKNMLTKEEFQQICDFFSIEQTDFHVQKNHYFDTPDGQLRAKRCGLRIRQLPTRNELTLKEPQQGIALVETTDFLCDDVVTTILDGQSSILAVDVQQRLNALQINTNDLQLLGTLSTTRAEINYKDGLLVFDYSQYACQEDYELEYEVQHEETGKHIFENLLKEQQIPLRPADKKLARFMKAINK